ncbi:NUDIX hydrolase [Candidatus Parcubacteria bacterium]|nr:MAG: NUDIX hydrolase [Candidatus Parcubacteria bacterium]
MSSSNKADAQPIEKYFVAAKAIVLDGEGRMLALLRGNTAPSNPLHWDLPGGILEYGEDLAECVVRETREEAGIEIDTPHTFHAIARMNSLGEFWTTIYMVARARSFDVTISWEHDEYKWVAPEEFVELLIPQRQKETVEVFLELRDKGKLLV